ncbi:protein of unknown function [Nitrospira defluvii]|uniref:Uncharacterized protein n=1 Tax=Nitrospira defluvii TaxID=330214 RepID=D8PGG7_9BACT|nr:protein of unknown function [Nitrospira defluvii]
MIPSKQAQRQVLSEQWIDRSGLT